MKQKTKEVLSSRKAKARNRTELWGRLYRRGKEFAEERKRFYKLQGGY